MSSHIIFDNETGLILPTTEEIRNEVIADYKNAFGEDLNILPQSPQGQLIDSQTAHIATKNTEILKLAQQFNPLTAEGLWQDALGAIYFIKRKQASKTRVLCLCKGLEGTIIPKGSLIGFEDSNYTSLEDLFYFALEEDITIPYLGEVSAYFTAEKTGPVEVKSHTLTKIVSYINGWDSVTNNEEGLLGRNSESQQEFERRRYMSVSKNAHGSAASVYAALANIEDVRDVLVLENRNNESIEEKGVSIDPHSIFISIIGGDDTLIAKTIYEKLSAGCGTSGNYLISYTDSEFHDAVYKYNITRPVNINVYIQVSIKLSEQTPATIVDDLKKVIYNNFYGLELGSQSLEKPYLEPVKMGNLIYSSRFYQSILDANVQELISVKLSFDLSAEFKDELFIPADRFPYLSYEHINIIIIE